jgi:GT2 family glycosyltransferase
VTDLAVAVITLTRDRLDYTQHCFAKLEEHAGTPFDHFVLDQASDDGTSEWLPGWSAERSGRFVYLRDENLGINRGLKDLLGKVYDEDDYDVVVKVDNDCELTQPNTLRDVCELAVKGGCLLSPRILGLRQPPRHFREVAIGGEAILDVPQIGGIFLAVPSWVYEEFDYSDALLGDDVEICHWFRRRGGTCGYVKRLEAWHYETTDGQHDRYPDYFARKYEEAGVTA